MKHLNPLRLLLLYLMLSLSSIACSDDEEENTPDPDNQAACKLTKILPEGEDEYIEIEYTAQGYASKLLAKEVGSNDAGDYTLLTYNADNQLIKAEDYENGQLVYYNTFEYTNGLLTTVKSYDDGTPDGVLTLKYDSNKRLIEQLSDSGNYKATYTYDSKGNLTKQERSVSGSLFYMETYENYDDKPTAFSSIQGLPGIYTDNFSKNNPGKSTRSFDSNGNGSIETDESEVITYTYIYNSNGFPTEVTETNSGDTEVTTFSYACQ